MAFRGREKTAIWDYIEEGLSTHGRKGALFVTGTPGLGKTRAVAEVLAQLQKAGTFSLVHVNAMQLARKSVVATILCAKLLGVKGSPADATGLLDHYFSTGRKPATPDDFAGTQLIRVGPDATAKPLVLVVDDADALQSFKDVVFLGSLAGWTQGEHSGLVVVLVLSAATWYQELPHPVKKQLGTEQVPFGPYSIKQCTRVVAAYAAKQNIAIEAKVVAYIAVKVHAHTSDIRRHKQVLDGALRSA